MIPEAARKLGAMTPGELEDVIASDLSAKLGIPVYRGAPRQVIPNEAVEAAAKALFARAIPATTGGMSWDEHPESRMKDGYRNDARAALEAAALHMKPAVTDEAFGYAVSALRGHGEFTTAEAEAAVEDIIDALGIAK